MEMFNTLELFQSKQYNNLQDDLAKATGLAIITVDYQGVPITSHSSCTEFCRSIRNSPTLGKLCERCDSRGGLEAARINAPYIYLCHAGLVDFAVPIVYNNHYMGAALGGQIYLADDKEKDVLEQIYRNSNTEEYDKIRNTKTYQSVPVMRLDRVMATANILFTICNYMIDKSKMAFELRKYSSFKIENEPIVAASENSYIADDTHNCKNPIIRPAFEYIRNNLNKDLSLKKVALVCNISESYFSRLFAKENIGTYRNYINHLKILQAKNLLVSTDLSVNEISDVLNFNDCSYFIKTFKLYMKTTPVRFRVTNKSPN